MLLIRKPFILLVLASVFVWAAPLVASDSTVQESTIANTLEYVSVQVNDSLTTKPLPLELPEYENLEELMEGIEVLEKRTESQNLLIAKKAAQEMAPLIQGIFHPSRMKKDAQYEEFALDLYQKNQQLQKAIEASDQRLIQKALQDQSQSCRQCHRTFKPKKKESPQK